MAEETGTPRGLVVLADGAQTAFAAGALAELHRSGSHWSVALGAGLGAQLAALALLGEASEGERRWRRQAELGCPLLTSMVALARERLGETDGVSLSPDPWTLPGWLASPLLEEHLAPEMGGLPERLARAGVTCAVAVADLTAGTAAWHELEGLEAMDAGELLTAAASFPCGWGSRESSEQEGRHLRWGGVAAIACAKPPWERWRGRAAEWDVVCGFPVPAVRRPSLGRSILELVQRRDEVAAATAVSDWLADPLAGGVHVIAPTAVAYEAWARRDTADLGIEYPLPWERNSELVGLLVELGRASARRL